MDRKTLSVTQLNEYIRARLDADPLLTEVVADIMGPEVTLVSAGEESAFELKRLLKADGLRADENRRGEPEFYVSDQPQDFERIASVFLQEGLRYTARRIDIDKY